MGNASSGAVALAPLVGQLLGKPVNPTVLSSKVDPQNNTHHLTVDESLAIMQVTKDHSILLSLAHAVGYVCIPVVDTLANTSDMELLNAWANWQRDIAETVTVMQAALVDGDIEQHEVARIKVEVYQDFAKGLELLQRFEALAVPQ